jgi:hypothetical protein
VNTFWSYSLHFVPNNISYEPISFILAATAKFLLEKHGSCIRRRYLALFWYDYFVSKYPGQKSGFDSEYIDLAHSALGVVISTALGTIVENIAEALSAKVRVGRRYYKLTELFGVAILLTLPTSIGNIT